MRICKESSSKAPLLFSIRKRHHYDMILITSQNEMVSMLIYNTFYGVTKFDITGVTEFGVIMWRNRHNHVE